MYEQHLYKQQILNSLSKDDQLVDNVKLHLRQKIISKLQSTRTIPKANPQLLNKICSSLFLQYLTCHQLLHTASVFAPESGASRASFSPQELRSMLRVEQNTLLRVDQNTHLSSLEQMIHQSLARITQGRIESETQTESYDAPLENKLKEIEENYKNKSVKQLIDTQGIEIKMMKYKNQLNKQHKIQIQQEIQRIRNFEVANIKMQEQEKFQIKVKEYEEQLETNYRMRMEKLREREAEVIQRVTNKMKEVETYNFQARQKILKEMEGVKEQQEQIQKIKAQLEQRERNIKRIENK